MPTQVQKRPAETLRGGSCDKFEHDPAALNKMIQHREALRLALGSILAPKRPSTPSSRSSSSGTASPAHPFSLPQVGPGSSTPLPPAPPHPTPTQGYEVARPLDPHLHPRHLHPHSYPHPHTPSRLGLPDSNDSPAQSPISSAHGSPRAPETFSDAVSMSGLPSPAQEHLPPLPPPLVRVQSESETGSSPPAIHAPAPVAAQAGLEATEQTGERESPSGSGTPKAKFLQTLQSKSAWDALIHGSFS